jgi:hypothetical protein
MEQDFISQFSCSKYVYWQLFEICKNLLSIIFLVGYGTHIFMQHDLPTSLKSCNRQLVNTIHLRCVTGSRSSSSATSSTSTSAIQRYTSKAQETNIQANLSAHWQQAVTSCNKAYGTTIPHPYAIVKLRRTFTKHSHSTHFAWPLLHNSSQKCKKIVEIVC